MVDQDTVIIGTIYNNVVDLVETLEKAQDDCFDFVVVQLYHPQYVRNLQDSRNTFTNSLPGTRSDLVLSSSKWSKYVVGEVSNWIDLDSCDPDFRTNSELVFEQEVSWASHLSLSACLVPNPGKNCHNYARTILTMIKTHPYNHYWVRVPLISTYNIVKRHLEEEEDLTMDSWEMWNKFRNLIGHKSQLGVALEFTQDIPELCELEKWLAEPVRAAILHTSIFQTNTKGAPILSPTHVEFLKMLLDHGVQIVISGPPLHKSKSGNIYQRYITHIFSRMPPLTEVKKKLGPFYDYLQQPLQPLMDNLPSSIYEVFEQDPVKYKQYEIALTRAFKDYKNNNQSEIVVMMVGAGRGPIVEAVMRARDLAKVRLKIYALDKNPHALVTLRNKKLMDEKWKDVVIVHEDMRTWEPPELCDILVSELLGSFGDNELSPECLQGAERLMKPNSISIPSEYTSYIAPISTTKLFSQSLGLEKNMELPCVVYLFDHFLISEPQPCFKFVHPTPKPINNDRYKLFNFTAKESTLLHGVAGYFDCCLYKDVMLSILPSTFTKDMLSWFPMYFPITTPITIKKGQQIEIEFWRKHDKNRVWYEWAISEPSQTHIHNPNGRTYNIGL